MPPAARITDMHTCPLVTGVVPHVGGPIITGEPSVLIGFMPAARVTDKLVCVGPPDMIAKGSATVKIGFLPAARLGDQTVHGGVIVVGFPTVIIGDMGSGGDGGGGGAGGSGGGGAGGAGSAAAPATDGGGGPPGPKTLKLKIVIVKGSYWDSEEGREKIKKQLADTERIMGIKIETGDWETVDDPSMKSYPDGKWDGTNNYSPEMVNTANKYGTPDGPAMIFTDDVEDANAITVGKAWAGTDDGLNNEAIIVGKNGSDTVVPHELGHLLSGQTGDHNHSDDKNNLMYGSGDRTGTEWTDPWKSAAEKNPYLK